MTDLIPDELVPPVISQEETRAYAAIVRSSEPGSPEWTAARNRIVEGNMRLALAIARERMPKLRRHDPADLASWAVMGLMCAAERFDPTTPYTFATFARHWIHRDIGRYAKYDTLVHIPYHIDRRHEYEFGESVGWIADGHKLPSNLPEIVTEEIERIDATPRQRQILRMILGLEGESGLNGRAVAKAIGVTHQYVNSTVAVGKRLLEARLTKHVQVA